MIEPDYHLIVTIADQKKRLDKFISEQVTDLSRSRIQSLIQDGHIQSDTVTVTSPSHKVKEGESYSITIPPAEPTDMKATPMPLDIVYEDEHLLVINKAAGMTVHPGAGNYHDTLANALLAHCGDSLSGIGGVERPGIVHRLDKDTSGLMVAAKTDKAHRNLSEQIANRTVKRIYNAVCWGIITPPHGTIHGNIGRAPNNRKKMAVVPSGGKESTTHYKTLEIFGGTVASLVECKLETGRTHQIRVHLTHNGHSLIGDPLYGSFKRKNLTSLSESEIEKIKGFCRQALHAKQLSFTHPETQKTMNFECDIPPDMAELIAILKNL